MIFVIVLYFLALFFGSFARIDPDFGWHFYLGKLYSDNGHLIRNFSGYNYFNNLPYIDHEWLSSLLMYKIYHLTGFVGITSAFFLVLALAIFLVYRNGKNLKASSLGIALALIIALFPISLSYNVRPYVFLFPLVPLTFLISRVKNGKLRFLFYFLLAVIGVNFHGGILLIMLSAILLELRLNRTVKQNIIRVGTLVIIILVSLLATPYRLDYLGIVREYLAFHNYTTIVEEWLPFYQLPDFIYQTLLPLVMGSIIFFATKLWKKIPFNQALFLLFYFTLAMLSIRFFSLFFLAYSPFLALGITELEKYLSQKKKRAVVALGGTIFILASLASNVPELPKIMSGFSSPTNSPLLPSKALEFINANQLPQSGNLLNPFELGGFILWTHPEIPIFIDGRAPQTPALDSTLAAEYADFYSTDPDVIKKKLTQFNIGLVLFQKPSALAYIQNGKKNRLNETTQVSKRLKSVLDQNHWLIIYQDNNYSLYQRP